MSVIRLEDGLVMDWSTMEKLTSSVEWIVPYDGKLPPGTQDRAYAKAWGSKRVLTDSQRACTLGWVAKEIGKPGIAGIIWHLTERLNTARREWLECYADKMRLDFLEGRAEVRYAMPSDVVPIELGRDALSEAIWARPWVCRVIGGRAVAGDSVRGAIDAAMGPLAPPRK